MTKTIIRTALFLCVVLSSGSYAEVLQLNAGDELEIKFSIPDNLSGDPEMYDVLWLSVISSNSLPRPQSYLYDDDLILGGTPFVGNPSFNWDFLYVKPGSVFTAGYPGLLDTRTLANGTTNGALIVQIEANMNINTGDINLGFGYATDYNQANMVNGDINITEISAIRNLTGGCVYNPNASYDMLLMLLLACAIFYGRKALLAN